MLTGEDMSGWLSREESLDQGLFRAHFENLSWPAFIWKRCSGDFELIAHNRAAGRLADVDADSLLGTHASDLHKNHPEMQQALCRCADRGEAGVQETDVTLESGVIRRMLVTRIPLSSDIVVSHIEDVTERRASVDALRTSERRFRALFESQPDLIFRMDVEGTYLDVHAPEGAVLPLRPGEIIGRTITDLFGEETAARHRYYATRAIRSGTVQVLEYEVSIGGKEIPVEARVVPSGEDEVVVNVRDIADRVAVEQALSEGRERGRTRIGRTLQAHQAQLHLAIGKLREAIGTSSPWADQEGVFRAIADLEAAVEKVDELARDLGPIPEGTPIVEALADLADNMERLHGITCRLTHDMPMPAMTEQVPDLYRIAQEAITNAVEHGAAKHVELICTATKERFVLNVIDDGNEFRLSAAGHGGLGMRIMRHRAKRLGGQLTRSRRGGGGTMVTCSCPLPASTQTDSGQS